MRQNNEANNNELTLEAFVANLVAYQEGNPLPLWLVTNEEERKRKARNVVNLEFR